MTTVISAPEGIQYARLASIKGRIKLEKVGMKFKGGSTRARVAEEFGLKPRAPHDEFIRVIEARMQEILNNR